MQGLHNVGNTCYINACLQIFLKTPELAPLISTAIEKTQCVMPIHQPTLTLFKEWQKFITPLPSATTPVTQYAIVTPITFIEAIYAMVRYKKTPFIPHRRGLTGDTVEIYHFLIDCLHTAIETDIIIRNLPPTNVPTIDCACHTVIRDTYSKHFSPIIELYYGIQVSILTKPDMTVWKYTPEPYFFIDLHITNTAPKQTLQQCLSTYIEQETIEDYVYVEKKDNKGKDISERSPVVRQLLFWSFPPLVAFHFKRMAFDGRKNIAFIDFPLNGLDLLQWTSNPAGRKGQYIYDAYAICNHNGGHYTAFILSDDKWIFCNDKILNVVSDPRSVITPTATCVFYRRRK